MAFAAVLVFSTVIGINFEHVYDHFAWNMPFGIIKPSAIYFNDNHLVHYSGDRNRITWTAGIMERIDEDTVLLNFTGGISSENPHVPRIPEFNFTREVDEKDSFIAWCIDTDRGGHAHIFRIYKLHDDFAIVNHFQAPVSPALFPCKYPDIIQHSLDFEFRFPTHENIGYIP